MVVGWRPTLDPHIFDPATCRALGLGQENLSGVDYTKRLEAHSVVWAGKKVYQKHHCVCIVVVVRKKILFTFGTVDQICVSILDSKTGYFGS